MISAQSKALEQIDNRTYANLEQGIRNISISGDQESSVNRFERLQSEAELMNRSVEMKSRKRHKSNMGLDTTLEDPMGHFEQGDDTEPPPCMPCSSLESSIFNVLIEKGVVELQILGYHDSKPKPPLMNIKISFFSGRVRHRHLYDQNTMEGKNDFSAQLRYRKCEMQKARRILEETLIASISELWLDGTYPSLKSRIWYTNLRNSEMVFINTKTFDLNAHFARVHHQIRQEELFGRCEDRRIHLSKYKSCADRHDALVLNGIQIRTVNRHEMSRREQLNMVLERAEQSCKKSAKENDRLSNIDTRINNEIVKYLLRQTEQFKNEITLWSDRYDEEIEMYDTELLMKKELQEEMQKQLAQLQEIFYKRDQEIEDYLAIKGARDLMNRKAEMCIMLQSWWRGTLFRKKLTPKTKGKKAKK